MQRVVLFLKYIICFSQNTVLKIPDGLQYSKDASNQDDWDLVDYQFKLDEIQTKIDYVKNSPEEMAKPATNSWLIDAYKIFLIIVFLFLCYFMLYILFTSNN